MLPTIIRWIFFFNQIGILIALVSGVVVMTRINRKLSVDHNDRELLRTHLMRASDTARTGVDALDPSSLTDRRKPRQSP